MKRKKTRCATITIPIQLAEKIQSRIKGTGFNSISSYVTYVLRQVLSGMETPKDKEKELFSEEDEHKVKERLKALGYMG